MRSAEAILVVGSDMVFSWKVEKKKDHVSIFDGYSASSSPIRRVMA